MLQKIIFNMAPWQKLLFKVFGYIFICFMTLGFLLSIAAFMIVRIDTPDYVIIPLTTFLLTFASFTDSFLLAKSFKEKGLLTGVYIGVIFSAIVICMAFYYGSFAFTNIFITKIAAVILAGMAGGLLGVYI